MPRSRPPMWSALAIALARTLPTVSLAACGANWSTACAWSAGSPRIRSTTRRAFIGVTRTYRALALASIGVSLFSGLSPAAPVILDVTTEGPRGSELAELVAHHRLGDEHRDVLAPVVDGDGVTEHGRNDHGSARPGLNNSLGALFVLNVHLLHQVVVDEGPLLQATRHRRLLLPLVLAAATAAADQPVTGLVLPTGTAFRLTPRADRVATARALALATAVRVVNRVHRDASHGRSLPLPAVAARLAELDVALLGVADLADGRAALDGHPADFTGWHTERRVRAFLGQQLDAGTGGPRDLRAATRPHLDRVYHGASRDRPQRERVAGLDVGPRAVLHPVALLQALRGQDVALLAVHVVEQRDAGGAVRVVLDVRDLRRDAVLVVPTEVDQTVGTLVSAALVPGGDPPVDVTATLAVQRADQRLLRLAPGDLGEVGAAGAAPAWGGRLVLTDCHQLLLTNRSAEDVDPVALGQGHDGALGVHPLAPAEPGTPPLALPVKGVHAGHLDPEHFLDRLLDLRLVGVRRDDERVLALVEQAVALLRDDRPQQDVPGVIDPAHSEPLSTNASSAALVKTT